MADSERRHNQIRIGTTAASTAYVGHYYIPDDSLLTDIGWVSGTAVTAAATAPFSLVISAISPAAVSTTLVTITTAVPLAVTSGVLTAATRYVIISIGTSTNSGASTSDWNVLAGTTSVGTKVYKAGDTFVTPAGMTGTGSGDGKVSPLTLPVANDTFGWAGYAFPLSHPLNVSGKATAASDSSVADVGLNCPLESRYYAADLYNPTSTLYGALPANAPYGGNVISTIKPEFAALGFGYTNRDGIRIPGGYTLKCAFTTAASGTIALANFAVNFATRPGRD